MKIKKKWIEYHVLSKIITSAIFDYLKRKGIKVNRHGGTVEGTTISRYSTGGRWVKIEDKNNVA